VTRCVRTPFDWVVDAIEAVHVERRRVRQRVEEGVDEGVDTRAADALAVHVSRAPPAAKRREPVLWAQPWRQADVRSPTADVAPHA
jgi:hypothetical protein